MSKSLIYLILLGGASLTFTAAATQQPSAVPAWHQSQETNTADAYTYTRFTLMGWYTAGSKQPAGRPALVIDCMPRAGSYVSDRKYLGAKLRAGDPLKVDYVEPREAHGNYYFPEVAVQYTADAGKDVEKDNWFPDVDKSSVSVPRSALKSFLEARDVAIVVQDDRGTTLAMRFNVPDPTQVADSCNLDLR